MLSSEKCISIIFIRDKYYHFTFIVLLLFYFGINLFGDEENEKNISLDEGSKGIRRHMLSLGKCISIIFMRDKYYYFTYI